MIFYIFIFNFEYGLPIYPGTEMIQYYKENPAATVEDDRFESEKAGLHKQIWVTRVRMKCRMQSDIMNRNFKDRWGQDYNKDFRITCFPFPVFRQVQRVHFQESFERKRHFLQCFNPHTLECGSGARSASSSIWIRIQGVKSQQEIRFTNFQ